MTRRVQESETASLAYDAVGSGIPLIAVHGAYSARGEVRGFLEPMIEARPVRRVYIDAPVAEAARHRHRGFARVRVRSPATG